MAGLCWVAVVLAFFLSAGNSLAAVDANWLASIVEDIKKEYALGDTFSLAVNVPQNQDPNDLQQVFQDDPADKVKQTVSEGLVYQGTRVVAAAQSGAVSNVLENIKPLMKNSQGNFLIIYSHGPTTNSNEDGITGKINDIIQNWSGYAFVFVPDADVSQMPESFKHLGISKIGLQNIFRCNKPVDDPFECTSCSSGRNITPSCVANSARSNKGPGVGEEITTVPPTDVDTGNQMASSKEMGVSGCGKGGKVRGQCNHRGGSRHRRGGNVRAQCKRRGGCNRRGGSRHRTGGKVRAQCKRRGGCNRRGGSRHRTGGNGRRQSKPQGGRRGKRRRGRKGRRWGKPQGGRRGKIRRGRKGRRFSKRFGGRGRSKYRGRRRKFWALQ